MVPPRAALRFVLADLVGLPRGCGRRRRGFIALVVTGLAGMVSRCIDFLIQPIRLVHALLLELVTLVLAVMILAIHLVCAVLIVLAIHFLSRAGHVALDLRRTPTRLGGRLRGEQDRQSEQYDACEQLANHGDTSVNDWGTNIDCMKMPPPALR
jgi:hypothetical protein